jgi:hypothetical protein
MPYLKITELLLEVDLGAYELSMPGQRPSMGMR